MVGDTGIEPVTSSVSGKRSPAELIARTARGRVEVGTGFEPVYTALQAVASPLGHPTVGGSGGACCRDLFRADDGIRTRDPHLGKVMRYQLRYVRICSHRRSPAARARQLYPTRCAASKPGTTPVLSTTVSGPGAARAEPSPPWLPNPSMGPVRMARRHRSGWRRRSRPARGDDQCGRRRRGRLRPRRRRESGGRANRTRPRSTRTRTPSAPARWSGPGNPAGRGCATAGGRTARRNEVR